MTARRIVATACLTLGLISHPASAGGNLRMTLGVVQPNSGDPYRGITLPAVLPLQAIFDTLTTLDAQGNAIPALALEWRAESPTSWILKLRPGVTFSNGEPFDSNAVVVSAQYLTSQAGRAETIGSTLYQ